MNKMEDSLEKNDAERGLAKLKCSSKMSSSLQTDFYIFRTAFCIGLFPIFAARERFPFEMHFETMSCHTGFECNIYL